VRPQSCDRVPRSLASNRCQSSEPESCRHEAQSSGEHEASVDAGDRTGSSSEKGKRPAATPVKRKKVLSLRAPPCFFRLRGGSSSSATASSSSFARGPSSPDELSSDNSRGGDGQAHRRTRQRGVDRFLQGRGNVVHLRPFQRFLLSPHNPQCTSQKRVHVTKRGYKRAWRGSNVERRRRRAGKSSRTRRGRSSTPTDTATRS
jgi:hypothetical protein